MAGIHEFMNVGNRSVVAAQTVRIIALSDDVHWPKLVLVIALRLREFR